MQDRILKIRVLASLGVFHIDVCVWGNGIDITKLQTHPNLKSHPSE